MNAALAGAPIGSEALGEALDTYVELAGNVLGLLPDADAADDRKGDLEPVMQVVLDVRCLLRERKLFDLTDVLRDRLAAVGIDVKDTKDGPIWQRRGYRDTRRCGPRIRLMRTVPVLVAALLLVGESTAQMTSSDIPCSAPLGLTERATRPSIVARRKALGGDLPTVVVCAPRRTSIRCRARARAVVVGGLGKVGDRWRRDRRETSDGVGGSRRDGPNRRRRVVEVRRGSRAPARA
jgi:hypothetical protein